MEWLNNKNEKCKFFLNHLTNHYTLVINGMYYEYNRFNKYNLIDDNELQHFSLINETNINNHFDFLKELSNKVKPFKKEIK